MKTVANVPDIAETIVMTNHEEVAQCDLRATLCDQTVTYYTATVYSIRPCTFFSISNDL